jgi:hypothetical protein
MASRRENVVLFGAAHTAPSRVFSILGTRAALAYLEAFMKYKNLIVVAALGVVFTVVAIAQERTPPMSSTPSAMGTTTPSVLKLETITPSATPPMAGTPPMAETPPMSGKPARRRRTPGAQTTPTAPYSTTPAPSPVMTAPSMTPVPPGR